MRSMFSTPFSGEDVHLSAAARQRPSAGDTSTVGTTHRPSTTCTMTAPRDATGGFTVVVIEIITVATTTPSGSLGRLRLRRSRRTRARVATVPRHGRSRIRWQGRDHHRSGWRAGPLARARPRQARRADRHQRPRRLRRRHGRLRHRRAAGGRRDQGRRRRGRRRTTTAWPRRRAARTSCKTALDAFGRVDIIINNAGILPRHVVQEHDARTCSSPVLDVHVKGRVLRHPPRVAD